MTPQTPQQAAEEQRQQAALNEWEREDAIRKTIEADKLPMWMILFAMGMMFCLGVVSAMFYVAFVEYPNYQRAYEAIQHR